MRSSSLEPKVDLYQNAYPSTPLILYDGYCTTKPYSCIANLIANDILNGDFLKAEPFCHATKYALKLWWISTVGQRVVLKLHLWFMILLGWNIKNSLNINQICNGYAKQTAGAMSLLSFGILQFMQWKGGGVIDFWWPYSKCQYWTSKTNRMTNHKKSIIIVPISTGRPYMQIFTNLNVGLSNLSEFHGILFKDSLTNEKNARNPQKNIFFRKRYTFFHLIHSEFNFNFWVPPGILARTSRIRGVIESIPRGIEEWKKVRDIKERGTRNSSCHP